MPSLTVVEGANIGDYFPLGKKTMVIGREEGCPVQLLDKKASRKHVQVRFDEKANQHFALDMKSANGTTLNGKPLTGESPLADNDVLIIGETHIVYSLREFSNKENALLNFKKRGQKSFPTIG